MPLRLEVRRRGVRPARVVFSEAELNWLLSPAGRAVIAAHDAGARPGWARPAEEVARDLVAQMLVDEGSSSSEDATILVRNFLDTPVQLDPIDVDLDWGAETLRAMYARLNRVEAAEIVLITGGIVLEDDGRTLRDYGLQDGATLNATRRLRGGGADPQEPAGPGSDKSDVRGETTQEVPLRRAPTHEGGLPLRDLGRPRELGHEVPPPPAAPLAARPKAPPMDDCYRADVEMEMGPHGFPIITTMRAWTVPGLQRVRALVRWDPPSDGPERTYHVLENTSVASLRALVGSDCGLEPSGVVLVCNRKILRDDCSMQDAEVSETNAVMAMRRSADVDGEERRLAKDGAIYTRQQFLEHYGELRQWDAAPRVQIEYWPAAERRHVGDEWAVLEPPGPSGSASSHEHGVRKAKDDQDKDGNKAEGGGDNPGDPGRGGRGSAKWP